MTTPLFAIETDDDSNPDERLPLMLTPGGELLADLDAQVRAHVPLPANETGEELPPCA